MLLQIDGTFLFVFISFIIFINLMKLICYKPIMKVMAEREAFYKKNEKTVEETNLKKEITIKEVEDEISKTKLESSKILKAADSANKEKKEALINSKKEENKTTINEHEKSLKQSSIQIKEDLKPEIETYVKSLVSKVLNQNPDNIQIDRQKINEILK